MAKDITETRQENESDSMTYEDAKEIYAEEVSELNSLSQNKLESVGSELANVHYHRYGHPDEETFYENSREIMSSFREFATKTNTEAIGYINAKTGHDNRALSQCIDKILSISYYSLFH